MEQIVAKQGRLPTGKAVITTGENPKAKYVIHKNLIMPRTISYRMLELLVVLHPTARD